MYVNTVNSIDFYYRSSVRLSVCLFVFLSVTRVDHVETVEDTETRFSPYGRVIVRLSVCQNSCSWT